MSAQEGLTLRTLRKPLLSSNIQLALLQLCSPVHLLPPADVFSAHEFPHELRMFALLLLSAPRMQPNQILLQLLLLLLKPALASTTSTPDSMRIHGRDSVGSSHVNTFHHHTLPSVCLSLSLYISVSLLCVSLPPPSSLCATRASSSTKSDSQKTRKTCTHRRALLCNTTLSNTAKLVIYKSDGG